MTHQHVIYIRIKSYKVSVLHCISFEINWTQTFSVLLFGISVVYQSTSDFSRPLKNTFYRETEEEREGGTHKTRLG